MKRFVSKNLLALIALFAVLCLSFVVLAQPVLAEESESSASAPDEEVMGITSTDADDASESGVAEDAVSDDKVDSVDSVGEAPAGDTTTTGEVEDAAEAEDSEEEAGIKFVLFEKLKKIDTKGWILFGAAVALVVIMTVYLSKRGKDTSTVSTSTQRTSPTLILVHGALCVALSFVLSYIKLFSMPQGGSITLASMLPIMLFANRYGVKWGLSAGLVLGILQYMQEGYFTHWLQFIFDYPLAFAVIGLGGMIRGEKNLVFSILIGGTARFLSHFIGGVIFWGQYIMIGEKAETAMTIGEMLPANIAVSFSYNAPYMFADIAICAVIALLPPFRKAIKSALKY